MFCLCSNQPSAIEVKGFHRKGHIKEAADLSRQSVLHAYVEYNGFSACQLLLSNMIC